MFKKISIFLIVFLAALLQICLLKSRSAANEYAGESIIYAVGLLGKAEYNDLGIVESGGRKLKLVTFRTQAFGFEDREKIYIDPDTLLPVRVERDISIGLAKEYLIEDYDQKNSILKVTKFRGNKIVKEYIFKEKGPIHNAVFFPFYLRSIPMFDIGWSFDVRFPNKFKIQLVSIEEIEVPAGKFMAYHFTSIPHKFEVWLSQDSPGTPLKIKGIGGFGYTLLMKRHILK